MFTLSTALNSIRFKEDEDYNKFLGKKLYSEVQILYKRIVNTVCYNFASAAVLGSAQNIATIQIVKKCRIIAFDLDWNLTTGAAAGIVAVECVRTGASGGTGAAIYTQNPQREILIGGIMFYGALATTNYSVHKELMGLSMNVNEGDILSLGSRLVSGTAYTAAQFRMGIFALEP